MSGRHSDPVCGLMSRASPHLSEGALRRGLRRLRRDHFGKDEKTNLENLELLANAMFANTDYSPQRRVRQSSYRCHRGEEHSRRKTESFNDRQSKITARSIRLFILNRRFKSLGFAANQLPVLLSR